MKINHKKDREYLLGLIESLSISKNNLKRDLDGYHLLVGKRGLIDTDGEFWYVRIECRSRVLWRRVKSSLQFMVLWQDGDDEGALRLDRYPSEEEAQKIRKICGFTVSHKLTEEEKKKLVERLNGRV